MCVACYGCFFFQAEDGIRDLVRSRGLGDVYKRQGQTVALVGAGDSAAEEATYLAKLCPKVYMLVRRDEFRASKAMVHRVMNTPQIEVLYNHEVKDAVSYTHLTLPTSDLV